jgi:hypothetical protein
MVDCGFGCKLHDLQCFDDFFSFIYLEVITNLRASSQIFVRNHQFNVSSLWFKQILDSYLVQYHLLAHHLHRLLKYVDVS